MNRGVTTTISKSFPNIIPVARPLVEVSKNIDSNWLAGFINGEGCFLVSILKSPQSKTGMRVQLRFYLAQHSRDALLFKKIQIFLNCGNFRVDSLKSVV
jgi:hypothetical protein